MTDRKSDTFISVSKIRFFPSVFGILSDCIGAACIFFLLFAGLFVGSIL